LTPFPMNLCSSDPFHSGSWETWCVEVPEWNFLVLYVPLIPFLKWATRGCICSETVVSTLQNVYNILLMECVLNRLLLWVAFILFHL
jgi:hypothetical protein